MLYALLACASPSLDTGTADTGATSLVPLAERLELARLEEHLLSLHGHADANAGTRLAGSAGYEAGLDWAEALWLDAGLAPVRQGFPHLVYQELTPPVLSWEGGPTAPEIKTLLYSPPGRAVATVEGVDLVLPPGEENSSTSGCEAEDFAGFTPGAIALIQRGTCTFTEKAENAQAAGASAVILFNEGQAGREAAVEGLLDTEVDLSIPVLGASFAIGESLASLGTPLVTVEVDTQLDELTVHNLLVDLPGSTEEIVVVGAHLDSVLAGPGINDNGSGTALVVELARLLAETGREGGPTLRFALWGAEESGLIGSSAYVDALAAAELDRHAAVLNFDMIGSPNGARFVYDGDDSAGLGGYPAPEGSAALEDLFTDWFDALGLPWQATAFNGRSDYGPFIVAGVPAGGLFTGAEQQKADSEVAEYGGQAGVAYDECYHQSCDTLDNVDLDLYLEMARAAAHATEQLALGSLLTARQPVSFARPVRFQGCGHEVLR